MRRPQLRFYDDHPPLSDMRGEVLAGLQRRVKSIPPKYFYDAQGSLLFDQICRLPEYYATRSEIEILRREAPRIAALCGPGCLLIELGSGSSVKVRILLDALRPRAYVPIDISREYLLDSARQLAAEHPWLQVHAACMDYTQQLELPFAPQGARKIVFFPGSSIGNFHPEEAVRLLALVAGLIRPDGALLIGVDLKKDPALLHAAYNDAAGTTAAFNKNLLTRMNRELQANFNLDSFDHLAYYDQAKGRIEMHLSSTRDQIALIGGRSIPLKRGERIHTENSYKYGIEEFAALGRRAGLRHHKVWTDAANLFSVHYFLCGRE